MFEQLVDGIFWDIALWVFAIGVLWRILSIFLVRNKPDYSVARESGAGGAIGTSLRRFIPRREMISRTRLQIVAGYMFHIGLFVCVFFTAPHVAFIKAQTGLSWPAMPHWGCVLSAEIAFTGLMLLWLHRILNPVTRLISDADDHIAVILTFTVMLTGCMALIETFEGLRLTHRFMVELWLVYFPFSRLMHAFTFLPSRAYTGAWFGRRGVKA